MGNVMVDRRLQVVDLRRDRLRLLSKRELAELFCIRFMPLRHLPLSSQNTALALATADLTSSGLKQLENLQKGIFLRARKVLKHG